MKKSFAAFFAVMIVAVMLLPAVPVSSGATPAISGTVSDSGVPSVKLGNVSVQLYDVNGPIGDPTLTDAAGFFSFPSLDPGDYSLTFSKETYGVSVVFYQEGGYGEIDPIDGKYPVSLSGETILTVKMSPTSGDVTGRVTNEDGHPLGEVKIDLKKRGSSTVLLSVKTDSDGAYTLTYSTGDYTLTASRSDYKASSINITIEASGNSPVDFVLDRNTNTFFFGMDLAHSLMFIGILLGVVAILAVAVYRIRLSRKDDTITVEEILDESEE